METEFIGKQNLAVPGIDPYESFCARYDTTCFRALCVVNGNPAYCSCYSSYLPDGGNVSIGAQRSSLALGHLPSR